MKKIVAALALATATMTGTLALAKDPAKDPAKNVSVKKHPNIALAQRLTADAFKMIEAAQKDNEFDMEGHAKRAKELLDQANAELKQAAQADNENGK